MKDIFKDILGIDGVKGVVMFSPEGKLLLSKFSDNDREEESRIENINWDAFAIELKDLTEAEFVFERNRFYIRKSRSGFLLVVLEDIAPVSMVRLNCEIVLPTLDRMKPGAGRLSQILRTKIF